MTRIPFYYTLKTIFLLYIALPQTQGSSYLYNTHLQPFFRTHETQIDSTLARVKARLYAFLQQRARMIWDQAAVAMGQAPTSHTTTSASRELEEEERVDAISPPTLANPMSGPMALVSTLWTSYGPGILAGGMALVNSSTAARGQGNGGGRKRPGASVLTTPPSSRIHHGREPSVEERKRELEAELAALNTSSTLIEGLPGGSGTSSRSSSDSQIKSRRAMHARSRSGSGGSGRFEEVEVPSDVEGDEGKKKSPVSAGGWFSGWGGSERVKND